MIGHRKEEIPESDTEDLTDDFWTKLDIESIPSVKSDDLFGSSHSHSSEQTSLTPILGAEGQTTDYRAQENLQLLETEDDTIQIFPKEIYQHAMLHHNMAVLEELRSGNADKTFHGSYFQDVSPQSEFCIPQSPNLIGQSTNYTSLKSGSEPIGIVQLKYTGYQGQIGSEENVKDTDPESNQIKRTFERKMSINLSSRRKSQFPTVDPSAKDKDFNQDRDNQRKSGSQHGKCHLISTSSAENVVSDEDEEAQNEICLNQHHSEVPVHSENVPPVTSWPVNMPFNVEQIYSGIPTGHVMPGYVNSSGVTDRRMVPPGHAGPYPFPLQATPFIPPGYHMNYSPYYWGPYGMPRLPPQPTVQHVPAQPKCPLPEAMSNTSHQDGAQPPYGHFSGHQEPVDRLRSVDVQAGLVEEDGGSVNMTGKPQCSSNAESFEQNQNYG